MFVNGQGQNEQTLQKTFHRCFLPNCSSFRKVVSEEKIFQKSTNQKQEWPVVAMFVNGSELTEHSLQRTFQGCFLPSFDPFGQINRHYSAFMYCFLASELSIEKKIKYSKQAAYSQSMGFAINISHAHQRPHTTRCGQQKYSAVV